ncbi:MAG: VWA domain-containing protein, partial [Humidesulfovibrio sp.]|nr:VWA domain-containing protein [Humidesulfovibrio sp.]
TMNPEEGELRPQLLDRFGLCVEVNAPEDLDERMEVLRRREAFDADPLGFAASWAEEERKCARAIVEARRALPLVRIPAPLLRRGTELCLEGCVAGHRADIALRLTARALAALAGREDVRAPDLEEAAELVLLHRRRMPPPPPPPQQEQKEQHDHEHSHEEQPEQEQPEQEQQREPQQAEQQPEEARASEDEGELDQTPPDEGEPDQADTESKGRPLSLETIFPVGAAFRVKPIVYKKDRVVRTGSGRRTRSRTSQKSGRYVKARHNPAPTDLALDATLRAAAPHQRRRRMLMAQPEDIAVLVRASDLRQRVREKRMGHFIIFVVDASGSMGAGQRMVETKGAVLSLLLDAYQKRDKVGLVAFRGQGASVLLPPTSSVDLAYKLLEELPTGGKTPLVHGLSLGHELLQRQLRRDPASFPVLVVISDGKVNVSLADGKPLAEARLAAQAISEDPRIRSLVVDVEKAGLVRFGLAQDLAADLGAQYFRIEDLKARDLVDVLRREVLEGVPR